MTDRRATCDILGAAFSISSSVALGKSAVDLFDLATMLDIPVSSVWNRLHPLVEMGICSVGADENGRLSTTIQPEALSGILETTNKWTLSETAPRIERFVVPDFVRRLETIAFDGSAPMKPRRGRPPNDMSGLYRSSRDISRFWKDFIARVTVEFGQEIRISSPRGPSACSPFGLAGAAMIAFGPDMSGRLSGPLDGACAVLGLSRQEIWPTLDRLLAISATTIRSYGDGGIDMSIAPAWNHRPLKRTGAQPTFPETSVPSELQA